MRNGEAVRRAAMRPSSARNAVGRWNAAVASNDIAATDAVGGITNRAETALERLGWVQVPARPTEA